MAFWGAAINVRNSITKPEKHKWRSDEKWWNMLKPLARELRTVPTPAEIELWSHLRNHRLAGLKFRRQHSIERFIVDFYCAKASLIVEVDGEIHAYTSENDALRQAFLESLGLTVCRIKNEDVHNNLSGVLRKIKEAAAVKRQTSPPR